LQTEETFSKAVHGIAGHLGMRARKRNAEKEASSPIIDGHIFVIEVAECCSTLLSSTSQFRKGK
jgi:hypothetical protein